jgi:hypothetical protein
LRLRGPARPLAEIVWVADRAFLSKDNRRYLRASDHHYVIGEKLRSDSSRGSGGSVAAGRDQDVAANLRVK